MIENFDHIIRHSVGKFTRMALYFGFIDELNVMCVFTLYYTTTIISNVVLLNNVAHNTHV